MFVPYKISADSLKYLGYNDKNTYYHLDTKKDDHISQLKDYLSSTDGVIDGDRISKLWFPHDYYNIFISHSHSDINMAHFLANWFETNCGLKCFVDADVWGNSSTLLRDLDRSYCLKNTENGSIYDYDKHNCCASHVFSMLSVALMEAIDIIECPIFIESTNSTPLKTAIMEQTLSPWIYEEVNFMTKLKRKNPDWLSDRKLFSLEDSRVLLEKAADSIDIAHSVPTDVLIKITSVHIKKMIGNKGAGALKALYNSVFKIY